MNDSVIQLITMSLTTFRSLTHLHPTQSSSIVLMNQIEEAECNDDLCECVEVIKMKDSIEQVSLTCDWLYWITLINVHHGQEFVKSEVNSHAKDYQHDSGCFEKHSRLGWELECSCAIPGNDSGMCQKWAGNELGMVPACAALGLQLGLSCRFRKNLQASKKNSL